MTDKKAKEILSHCEHMDALANNIKSYSAFVKAEMYAFLGGVGTAQRKRKNDSKIKSEQEAEIRAQFRRK
jgi:hypothetical protein